MSDNFNSSGTPTGAANPYSAPKADLTAQRAPDEAELAGRGRRFGAAFIDGIIMMVVMFVPLIMFFGGWGAYAAKAAEGGYMLILASTVLGFVAYLLVHGYFLATKSQSIGKMLLGIKIVRTDGSPIDFARIVTHRLLPVHACGLIPVVGSFLPLLDALFIFRKSKKCIHDDIADTVVIRI